MSNKLEDFSKDLATGVSRRNAFLKFLSGAGTLGVLGLGAGLRKAEAVTPAQQTACINECIIGADINYDFCTLICDAFTREQERAFCQNVCFVGADEYGYLFCSFFCTHPVTLVPAQLRDIKGKAQEYAIRLTRKVMNTRKANG